MEISESTVQKIREFAQTRQEAENEYASEPPSATALHVYARRLDGTLKALQEQFRRQEEDLNKVRSVAHPSTRSPWLMRNDVV